MKKILIVEDESFTALWLYETLTSMGYQVLEPVSSGSAAYALASLHRPDFILMDIQLSGNTDGIETARIIQNEACGHNSRIIFLTGFSPEDLGNRLEGITYSGLITKPVIIRELTAIMNQI